jgi:hypothetical protein
MVNQRFCLLVLVVIVFLILYGIVLFAEERKITTCRLASQILTKEQRVCIFVGANHTQYREYVPYDAGECPREYQCPYRPNEKPFDLKSVIKSIKDQFTK